MRDTVEWIISEPMLVYYLTQFKDAYWPSGGEVAPPVVRTHQDKLRTRMLAKEKFLGALMGKGLFTGSVFVGLTHMVFHVVIYS